jgi:hypothetical protein
MNAALRMMLVCAICFIPAVAVGIANRRQRRLKLSRSKSPFKELRRRPPGEAIRVKLAEFEDKISEYQMWLVVPPALVAMSAMFVPSWISLVPAVVLSLVWTAVVGFKMLRITRKGDDYRLGFEGERFVGEELNQLVAKRFEVYHDVPFDGFNMDHVLVGPPGVFLVETKTRRKPINEAGNKEYRVEFDGARLRWPWGTDTYGLDQSARNAQTLAQWLSGAVGESVLVTAILTLPGWMVDRKAASKVVHVLNPKEIVKLVDGQPANLNETLIKRICYQLDQKCKMDVE